MWQPPARMTPNRKAKIKRLNRVGKFRKVECCKIKKHEEQMGGGNVAKLDDS